MLRPNQLPPMLNVGIIENDEECVEIVSDCLVRYADLRLCWAVSSVEDYFRQSYDSVEVLLLDIGLPGLSGTESLSRIKEHIDKIIMLTTFRDQRSIVEALRNGATAFIVKDAITEHLCPAIRCVARGKSYFSPTAATELTGYFRQQETEPVAFVFPATVDGVCLHPREQEVGQGIVEGLTYKEIGNKCNISLDTVRHYVKSLYKKLKINSQKQLTRKFYR